MGNWIENLMQSMNMQKTGTGRPKRISPMAYRTLKEENPGLTLLDVRTTNEYRSGHIPGSKVLPVQDLARQQKGLPRDKGKPIVVYCQSGARSRQAAHQLSRMGFTDVHDLGGIYAWPYETVRGSR